MGHFDQKDLLILYRPNTQTCFLMNVIEANVLEFLHLAVARRSLSGAGFKITESDSPRFGEAVRSKIFEKHIDP